MKSAIGQQRLSMHVWDPAINGARSMGPWVVWVCVEMGRSQNTAMPLGMIFPVRPARCTTSGDATSSLLPRKIGVISVVQ